MRRPIANTTTSVLCCIMYCNTGNVIVVQMYIIIYCGTSL